MIKLEDVKENIKGLEHIPYDQFENEIIIAFSDYEFNGITEVIVNEIETGAKYEAYINEADSEIITIITKTEEDSPGFEDQLTVLEII